MRKAFLGFLLVLGLLVPALPAAAVTVERITSPGGIEAWLVRDHTNPIISVELAFRGGSALDPEGKAGLANMAAGLIDEGAGDLDSYAFQKELEDTAIKLRFSAGRDSFHGSLRTLTENRERAFELLRLALTQPRFDEEPVGRIRSQILAGLARDLQDPDVVAGRTFNRVVYPNHPYGTPTKGSPETVKAITTDDLRAFTKRRFGRDNLLLGIVGDITPEQLGPLLDATFGALPAKAEPWQLPDVAPKTDGEVTVVQWRIPQSIAVFGQPGLKRRDPDWYAAYVMNYILGGGGFTSRLMEEVRAKRGLAYSVYSYLQPLQHSALMIGGVATENARLAESLELVRAEWRRMREEGPTPEELANAKTYLTGSFPLQLDSTASIAGILVSIQVDDLGIDFLDRRNDYIEAVSLEDVRRVAGRLLEPTLLTAVVVGTPAGLTN